MGISKRHDPEEFKKTVGSMGFKVVEEKYCHFHFLPYPFSKTPPFSWINNVVGRLMEWFFNERRKS